MKINMEISKIENLISLYEKNIQEYIEKRKIKFLEEYIKNQSKFSIFLMRL